MIDNLMYCIIAVQDRAKGLRSPPRALQNEIMDQMIRQRLFHARSNLTFTELVGLAVKKGLVHYDAATGILTTCAMVAKQ
jgi:hypothetical protein